MKHFYFLLFTFFTLNLSFGQTTVFINELHYDDAGADAEEGVEIAGPAGTSLATYTITAYNGNGGASYKTESLSGVIPDLNNTGYGTVFFPISGLQNGAPDGIALDNNGTLIQFLSYEGSFAATNGVASGVTSTDIGVAETSSTADGESLQLTGSGTTYENFTWSGPTTNTYDAINTGQTFGAATPTITISAPSNNAVFSPGTSSVDLGWSTNNLSGSETVDVVVNGTTTNNATSPFGISTTDGQTYSVTVNLVDGGSTVATDNVSFSVGSYTQVNDIAALRAGTEGDFYELSGEVFISYIVTDNNRNQKYIQDQSGGILIDDSAGTLSTVFNIGDGISGLKGELGGYAGVTQFVPTENVASASSTGNTITPQTITVADFILPANADLYESQLIRFDNVTFSDTGAFAHNQNYSISQGTDGTTVRVTFNDEDLIGASIPSASDYVIGLAAEYNGSLQILPRYMSDVQGALTTEDYRVFSFEMYPNPTNTGFVTIKSNQMGAVQAQVFDLLGKEVINTTVNNERMDVSNLNAGVYVVKLTQNKNTTTKKLIVQ
ncbi:MAG: T9SS type A sorting domain-containing protein [Flavobacteriaceae bacterium]